MDRMIKLQKPKGELDLGSVRPSRLRYMLAYVFEMILFVFRGHFFSLGDTGFGVRGHTLALALHGVCSLVVMLLWRPRFRGLIRVSAAVAAAGFIPLFLLPEGPARLIAGLVAYAGLGGSVTAARCGYAFALNDSERLIGMAAMLFVTSFIRCTPDGVLENGPVLPVAGIVLFAGMCICLLRFREADLQAVEESSRRDARGMYWALAYFILYFAVDGCTWDLLDLTGRKHDGLLFLGLTLALGLFLLLPLFFRKTAWVSWNVFFFAATVTAVLGLFHEKPAAAAALNVTGGVSVLGWPLSICLLGNAQSRFASYRLLKKCTVIFVLASPLANFADVAVERFLPGAFPVFALVLTAGSAFVLLMLSPFSYRDLFACVDVPEGPSDACAAPGETGAPPRDPFAPYGLTPRQREVAALLLQAKTRRQIAGELGLSESTVKTHTSELYRRLGINSRVELFRMFGAAEETNAPG